MSLGNATKATVRHHCTPVRLAKIDHPGPNVAAGGAAGALVWCWWEGPVDKCSGKQLGRFLPAGRSAEKLPGPSRSLPGADPGQL